MKILLTHPYFQRRDPKQWHAGKPYPPLGTLYAAAYLREQAHDIRVHDTFFADGPESLQPVLDDFKPDVLVIYDDGFNWLTKMCLSTMQEASFDMIRRGKQAGCTVLVCGSDASDHRQRYLETGADAILLGEGEITLGETITRLERGESLESTLGLALLDEGEVRLTGRRPPLKDLDTLPRPAWDLIDLKPYEDRWRLKHGYWSLNMVSTRGCPYGCSWCAKPIYGNQYMMHSPERVVDDIATLKERFDFEHVWFADDIFGLRSDWLQRFAGGLKERKISIRSMIQARVDLLTRPEIVEPMVEAGIDTVWMGVESGSQKIMDAMNKGITVEQVHEATRLLRRHGVKVAYFLQFGYLGETREDIDATLDLVLELQPDDLGISVSYPLPGTPFYEQVKNQLREKTNWTDSDDLALMYRSTFSPDFYRRLHRYVHRRYRTRRGLSALKTLVTTGKGLNRRSLKSMVAIGVHAPAAIIDGFRLKRAEGD